MKVQTSGKNRVFAAVFPHSDDFSISAGGTMLSLLDQGCAGYFIRLTNDEKDSHDLSIGETIFRIEKETEDVARMMGIRKVFHFNYKNHYLTHDLITEIRHRLIFLFRLLKVDVVLSFDPWGHYEENPDHYICGMAVEQACWMAGRSLDLPELADAGLQPYKVQEKYYVGRGEQTKNLFVDIGPYIERKRELVAKHVTPMRNMWDSYLRKHPGPERPISSIERFIDHYFIEHFNECREDMRYYEAFHHIQPDEY